MKLYKTRDADKTLRMAGNISRIFRTENHRDVGTECALIKTDSLTTDQHIVCHPGQRAL